MKGQPSFDLPTGYEDHRIRNDSTCSMLSNNITSGEFKRLKIALYIFVIVTSSIAIVAGAFAIYLWVRVDSMDRKLSNAQAQLTDVQNEAMLCLPCYDLSQGPFPEDNAVLDNLEKRQDNDTEVCCAKTSRQADLMLNLVRIYTCMLTFYLNS